MSDHTASIKAQLWQKMRSKDYRESFVSAHLSTNIAAQIRTIRESRNWTQRELGEKTGMAAARISVMENPSYEKITISTLKRLASAFDVALMVRFAPFSELVNWVSDLSPEKIGVKNFDADSIGRESQSVDTDAIQVSAVGLGSLSAQLTAAHGQVQVKTGIAERAPSGQLTSPLSSLQNERIPRAGALV